MKFSNLKQRITFFIASRILKLGFAHSGGFLILAGDKCHAVSKGGGSQDIVLDTLSRFLFHYPTLVDDLNHHMKEIYILESDNDDPNDLFNSIIYDE